MTTGTGRAAAAKAAPDVVRLRSPEMMKGLLKELPGRVWEGKESLPGCVAEFIEACPESAEGENIHVITLLVAEAGRKKATYRKAAIAALDRALAALAPAKTKTENENTGQEDFFPTVLPLLRELLGGTSNTITTADAAGNTVAEMEEEAARVAAEAKTNDAVADQCLRCLATLCAGSASDAMRAGAAECASFAHDALAPSHGWTRRAAACAVVTAAASRVALDGSSKAKDNEQWLVPLRDAVVSCAEDPRVSQLRVSAVDALVAVAQALKGSLKSETRVACIKQLELMRDGDRAPDVRGAAGKALANLGA